MHVDGIPIFMNASMTLSCFFANSSLNPSFLQFSRSMPAGFSVVLTVILPPLLAQSSRNSIPASPRFL